jgi:L-aminopeptidase/D-esterase-like protein
VALGVGGLRVGVWTHSEGHTGTTVVLPPTGTVGGMAVRGASPGTREAAALGPTGKVAECHAAVLSGGSAFGLATGDGVTRWLAARGVGYEVTPGVRVPIVGGAIVFDLRDAATDAPGAAAGRGACEAATSAEPPTGQVGVGAGCAVGKTAGAAFGVPAGQGVAIARGAGLSVGALVGVNAFGDVLDERGAVLAGSTAPADQPRFPYVSPPHRAPPPTRHGPVGTGDEGPAGPAANTVIGCVVTDARLDKPQACRTADLAHGGVTRAVEPAHTSFDGDALFCLATGAVEPAHPDLVTHLAVHTVAEAIRQAVRAP